MTLFFIVTIIVSVVFLTAIALMRQRLDFLPGARIWRALTPGLALFVFATVALFFSRETFPERKQIAVFPSIDFSFDENLAWKNWSIADQTIRALTPQLDESWVVLPLEWTWQSVDKDSVQNPAYQMNYARRAGVEYVLLSSHRSECKDCLLQWEFIDIQNGISVQKGEFEPENSNTIGKELAAQICHALDIPFSTRNQKEVESFLLIWQAKQLHALAQREYEQAIFWGKRAFYRDSVDVIVRNRLSLAHMQYSLELKREGKPGNVQQLMALNLSRNTITYVDSLNGEAHRLIAKYYILQRTWTRAEAHARKSLQLDPNLAATYVDITSFNEKRLKMLGFDNQEKAFRYALHLNPGYELARLWLANHYYFNRVVNDARKELETLLNIHPRSIDGWLLLGKIAVSQDNMDEIIDIYNRILEIDPYNPHAFYNLGVYYFTVGDIDHAREFFQRAVQYGNHANSHLYLGYIHEAQGEMEKAIKEYRLRIRLKQGPDDVYARQAMKRLYTLTNPDSADLKLDNK
jgi:tetratricopeptide (TPR) repeat protein